MEFPKTVSKILDLAGPEDSQPFDRLQKGKPIGKGKEAVAKSGLKLLLQGALYLYFDCFEEAHTIANDHEGSVEGNWIHAILHRREPDAWNSKYWYHRVHAPAKVLQAIGKEALSFLKEQSAPELESLSKKIEQSGTWEPEAFVDLCDKFREKDTRLKPYQGLAQIQEIEWQGLVDYILTSSR